MGLFDKLFARGKKSSSASPTATPQPEPDKLVKVFDSYDRELYIDKETWRRDVLLPNLAKKRSDPDALYGLIVQALEDGHASEVLQSARRLAETDTIPVRGVVLHGVTLLALKRYEDARDVLEAAVERLGEEAYLATNLAKAYAGMGDAETADRWLWRSLELDPNQQNALDWFAAQAFERGDEKARLAAYQQVATIPTSWRPQLWLAKAALTDRDLDAATKLYERVLDQLPEPPADALMQISGDLGNAGYLKRALDLCKPRFNADLHGLLVGNNLIKAHLDLGQPKEARDLLERLFTQQRPDWKQSLAFWDEEIAKVENHYGPLPPDKTLEIQLLTLDTPIWTRNELAFEDFLPSKDASAPHVLVVCASGTKPGPERLEVVSEKADDVGRVTRGLPMLIAETLILETNAKATLVVPWVKAGGFVFSGQPWDRELPAFRDLHGDFVLLTHIDAHEEPWTISFELSEPRTGNVLASWTTSMDKQNAVPAIVESLDMVRNRVPHLTTHPNKILPAPPRDLLAHYVVALEQALTIGVATLAENERSFLVAERSILDNLLGLAVESPASIRLRMLLLSAMDKEMRRRPDIVGEYQDRLRRLQHDHPIQEGNVSAALEVAVGKLTAEGSLQ